MKRKKKEFFCPNCGAALDEQDGFDPSLGAWECAECGQELFGDKVESTQKKFKGVIWYCDNCNTVLSTQPGFADYLGSWTCTECGYENSLTEDDILDSSDKALNRLNRFLNKINGGLEWVNEKVGHNEDDVDSLDSEDEDYSVLSDLHIHISHEIDASEEDDDDGYDEHEDDFEDDNDDLSEITPQSLAAQNVDKPRKLSISKKLWYHISGKKFEVKQSSDECVGMAVSAVVKQFFDWGFQDVNTVAEEDLDIEDIDKDGTVISVTINGYSSFAANSLFPFNSSVTVYYHTLRRVMPPITSKRAKGKDYREVVETFINAGFCNVEARAIYDLTLGWLITDGAVESIEIEGQSNYLLTANYRLDVTIVVSYHTFKKKR